MIIFIIIRNKHNHNLPIGLYLSSNEFTPQLGPKNSIVDFTWLLQSKIFI